MEDKTAIWKGIFSFYQEVQFFPAPEYNSIMGREASLISPWFSNLPVDKNPMHVNEFITYFYDFSAANLPALSEIKNPSELERFLVLRERNPDRHAKDNKVIDILKRLSENRANITHILRSAEISNSLGRTHVKAEVFDLKYCGYVPEPVKKERKPDFKISFLEAIPGCGCGCKDNDLEVGSKTRRVSREFYGTRKDAEKFTGDLARQADSCTRYDFSIEEVKNGKI